MVDLLKKFELTIARYEAMLKVGTDVVGVVNEQIVSPTRGIINGKEVILAGTKNYMGVTFNEDCIAAGKKALDDFGTGTTGSRIANGTYQLHMDLEKELASFLDLKHCIVFSTG